MLRFVARRLLQIVPVLFVIITATFFMVRFVPGGPFTAEKAIPPEILKNLEAHYGLDRPLWRQYVTYLGQITRGNLGPSFKYANRSVNEIIAQKLPVSLELGGWAMLIALTVGLPLGIFAAARQNTWLDYLCSTTGMIGICVPTFVLGPVLALVFGIYLQWLNVSGWDAATDRILPGVTLGFVYAAYVMRLTRGGMLEVLNQDFIRTARAKGASGGARHLPPRPARRTAAGGFLSWAGDRRHFDGLVRHRNDLPDPRPRPGVRQQRLQPRLHPRPRHRHPLRDAADRDEPGRRRRAGVAQPEAEVRVMRFNH